MAVLKHIASKNADYGQVLRYLLFQHDEETGKPLLDDQERMILRQEYYMDGILCDPMAFDYECEMVNDHFNKNKKYNEIKSHHYIISFDPADVEDHGLTGKRAQKLCLDFAEKYFPGHQALVVTHTDGNRHSGNIHTHIVINSVRKEEVPREDYMTQASEYKAGCKHHLTRAYLKFLEKEVMDMCIRNGLHQVDLLKPADQKITQKEYWAGVKGQKELEQINQEIIAEGLKPASTVFLTDKQQLRNAVDEISRTATGFDEFQTRLFEKYGILVEEKRGRFGYLCPGRDKHLTERSLGSHYGKTFLLEKFGRNRNADKRISYDYHQDPMAVFSIPSTLRLVVDLQNCIKASQNHAYAQKVKISNLQKMADTLIYLQEHHYDTQEQLAGTLFQIRKEQEEVRDSLSSIDAELRNVNREIHFTGQYLANKKTYQEMLHSRYKGLFRKPHEPEITAYEEARKFFSKKAGAGGNRGIPSMKELRERKQELMEVREADKDQLGRLSAREKELTTVASNVKAIFDGTLFPQKKRARTGPEL